MTTPDPTPHRRGGRGPARARPPADARRAQAPARPGRPRGAARPGQARPLEAADRAARPGPGAARPPGRVAAAAETPRLPDSTAAQRRGETDAAPRLPARAMTRRPTSALVASPVLVGAVTVLVAMRLGRSSPTSQLRPAVRAHLRRAGPRSPAARTSWWATRCASAASGSAWSRTSCPAIAALAGGGDEGRAAGDRRRRHEARQADRAAAAWTRALQVRPRSALGLKYIELKLGRSRGDLRAGRHDPARQQSIKPIELDEFFSLHNEEFRKNLRTVFEGYGTALAGPRRRASTR